MKKILVTYLTFGGEKINPALGYKITLRRLVEIK